MEVSAKLMRIANESHGMVPKLLMASSTPFASDAVMMLAAVQVDLPNQISLDKLQNIW